MPAAQSIYVSLLKKVSSYKTCRFENTMENSISHGVCWVKCSIFFRGITNISIRSSDALTAHVVGNLIPVNSSYGPGAKMVQIEMKESSGGVRRICLEASDKYV